MDNKPATGWRNHNNVCLDIGNKSAVCWRVFDCLGEVGRGGGVKRWRIPSFELNINLCCCCFQRNWKTRRNVCTHRRKCKLWAHSSASQICGSVYCEWNLIHLFVFQNSDTQKKEEYWPFDFLSTALSLLLCGMEPLCQRYSINLKAATAFPKIQKSIVIQSLHRNSRRRERWETGEKCKDDSVCVIVT